PVKGENGTVVLQPKVETKEKDGKVVEKVATISANEVEAIVKELSNENKQVVVSLGSLPKGVATKVDVPATLFTQAANKQAEATIVSASEQATYKLPVKEVQASLATIAQSLGATIEQVSISIEMKVNDAPSLRVKPLSDAVEFHVVAKANGQERVIDRFTQYVEREIALKQSVNASRAIAVRVNDDGSLTPVPTTFVGNKAVIKSLTNSTYVVVEGTHTFSDIQPHWAKGYIETLAAKQLVKGMTDTTYRPNDRMTRAQFAVLLVRALGLPSETYDGRFADVKGTEWFNKNGELAAAVKFGIIQGKTAYMFAPNEPITRAQAAVMIERALKLSIVGYDEATSDKTKKVTDFRDAKQLPTWAKQAIEAVYQAGIMQGRDSGNFDPTSHVTRAEMAKVLAEFLTKGKLM
ncbi:S-layer homology domain-containing protein, partial [Anoxybacillus ayderensis]|uniref:S-layer homology domain-containing protein n=1 Tax=Anoxybacillus ayderensis TaxID=265546 RepID=UPI000A27C77F